MDESNRNDERDTGTNESVAKTSYATLLHSVSHYRGTGGHIGLFHHNQWYERFDDSLLDACGFCVADIDRLGDLVWKEQGSTTFDADDSRWVSAGDLCGVRFGVSDVEIA